MNEENGAENLCILVEGVSPVVLPRAFAVAERNAGACQDRCPKNHHETGVASGWMRSSCLTGLRYTGPMGDQLRVEPVHRSGVRFLAWV